MKEIILAISALAVILAVARYIGGLSTPEVGFFLLGVSSTALASTMRKRWYVWPLAGLIFLSPVLFIPVADKHVLLPLALAMYGLMGAPVAIASARNLHMRRWWISAVGVLTVSVALTPPDLITTLLVYTPLQLAMFGYAFLAKDGPAQPEMVEDA